MSLHPPIPIASSRRLAAWCAWVALRLLLVLGWSAVSWFPGQALAAPPMRVGIYHPQPHLCPLEEPSQRDLRVLRMLWRLDGSAEGWRAGPPFYRLEGGTPPLLVLDTLALWGMAPGSLAGMQQEFGERFGENRLAAWSESLPALVSSLDHPAWQAPGRFTVDGEQGPDPFLPSRLGGFRTLPALVKENISTPNGNALEACRTWPQWVRWERGGEDWAYRATLAAEGEGRALELRGYRDRTPLWRDYLWGRLDALLLEGPDIDSHVRRRRRSQVGGWGVAFGGQQLVLRWGGDPAALPDVPRRAALSRALDRAALGKAVGEGWFLPPPGFMTPWLARDALPAALAMRWNALGARRAWLKAEGPRVSWRLLVLKHPVLQTVAEGIQAQWRRTLNVDVTVEVLPVDRWASAIADGRGDWFLDVVDMDDGSLQELWRSHLPPGLLDGSAAPEAMEEALRAGLPYLPLLGNAHWMLLRKGAPPEVLPAVCPGCFRASSPVQLRADPVERVDPQG